MTIWNYKGEMRRVKVLSVRQPWATAIVLGWKGIENRSWSTRYRGRLYIHAAATRTSRAEYTEAEEFIANACGVRLVGSSSVPPNYFGAVIGHVDVVDVVKDSGSSWFTGPFGWVLHNAKDCEPIPMKGRLGIFEATLEV